MSPGFGGLAAVLAALVAYAGVRRTVRARRAADRKQQWWDRARWALDLTLDADEARRAAGQNVLTALVDSEYADEHETDLIDVAVGRTLEAWRVQSTVDAGVEPSAEAELDTGDEQGGSS